MKLELSKVKILSLECDEVVSKDDVRGVLYGTIEYKNKKYDAAFYGDDYEYFWDAGQLEGLVLNDLDTIVIDNEEVEIVATDEEVKKFLKELGV